MGLDQQLADFKAEILRTAPAGRPALYEAKIEELRAGFALEAAVGVEARAPDFRLPDVRGNPVSLTDLLGRCGIYGQNASYMTERFPTEVRATASGFCYHQGAIFGGLMGPIMAYAAITWQLGFAIPMLIGTWVGLISFILALLYGPETKGKQMVADLTLA